MIYPTRILFSSLASILLLSACGGSDVVSPVVTPVAARPAGGSTSGGVDAGGTTSGGGKAPCTNTLSVAGTATEALTGNAFSATYALVACQSRTRVWMTATDLAIGTVVWQSVPDLAGTIALWTLPYRLTSYRINAYAVAGSTNTTVATASTTVSTLNPLPCDVFVRQTVTVGYYLTWAAIWAATDAQDCGQGGTVHLQITNMTTGKLERDYVNLGRSTMIDFEGPIVSYSTPYRVYAELKSYSGAVLASSTTDVVSSPIK